MFFYSFSEPPSLLIEHFSEGKYGNNRWSSLHHYKKTVVSHLS